MLVEPVPLVFLQPPVVVGRELLGYLGFEGSI